LGKFVGFYSPICIIYMLREGVISRLSIARKIEKHQNIYQTPKLHLQVFINPSGQRGANEINIGNF